MLLTAKTTLEPPVSTEALDATLLTRKPFDASPIPAQWIARTVIIIVTAGFAWYTWGHWGDFQVDCGREIYVPAAILQGKLLFRDLWYMYGPLAPYLQAALFRIFGIHLTVLYLFGLSLTLGTALLAFEVARQLKLATTVSVVPSLLFLSEAFHPGMFSFVFPYSYAASLACFLGIAFLYFLIRHASERRPAQLLLAAVFTCLQILTKQEFGIACFGLLVLHVNVLVLTQHSRRELWRNLGLCSAGIAPAVIVYGCFIWKTSARSLFLDNWISTPGTYFMHTFAKLTMAEQGFRFVPSEILQAIGCALIAICLWFVIAYIDAALIAKIRHFSRASSLGIAALSLVPLAILVRTQWAARVLLLPLHRIFPEGRRLTEVFGQVQWLLSQAVIPKGLFFIGIVFLILSFRKIFTSNDPIRSLQMCSLAVYAVSVGFRQMMGVSSYTAVFFNLPLLVVFVIVVLSVVRYATTGLGTLHSNYLASTLLLGEAVLVLIVWFPNPQSLPAALDTGYGTFYTRPDVAVLFPQIIAFMKTHTKNGKDILILPEPPSLYTFAGMEAPSRWYSLLPGYIAPEQEGKFISEVSSNSVRFVLITDRTMGEYGGVRFGDGYNETIFRWIAANYTKVGQFGPLPNAPAPPYAMAIYARNHAGTDAQ